MAALDVIGSQYDALRTARRRKEEAARDRINSEMAALQVEFDALILRATDEGSTIAAIAREMGASRSTVYAMKERAEALRETTGATLYDPLAERYKLDADGAVVVSLTPADLENVLGRLNWSHTILMTRPELATLRLVPVAGLDRVMLEPETDFLPADGKRHPVAGWFERAENDAEATAWYLENTTPKGQNA